MDEDFEQQARAYKREVDDLTEKLTVAKEDKLRLQETNYGLVTDQVNDQNELVYLRCIETTTV